MASSKNKNNQLVNQLNSNETRIETSSLTSFKKPARMMKATDFLSGGASKSNLEEPYKSNIAPEQNKNLESLGSGYNSPEAPTEGDYHVRAGRIGGQTTKQRHRDSNFYKEIG